MCLMMDIEISCKGHCESFSHFLYLVSYSVFRLLSSSHTRSKTSYQLWTLEKSRHQRHGLK